MIRNFVAIICLAFTSYSYSQSDSTRMYQWKTSMDVGILTASAGLNTYFLIQEPKGKRFITLEEILSVTRDEIPSYDVSATYNWSETASSWSDVVQLASIASPLLLLGAEEVRNEKWTIALMGFEALALNQGISGAIKLNAGRKRPYVYNEDAPDEIKYRRQVFYSFPSAHTSASAAATFFGATVYNHYFPDSKWKTVVWISAATLPAVTGYLRYEGGRHFLTDVAGGYLLGASIGMLIPRLHRINSNNLKFGAFGQGDALGLSMSITLD